MFRCRVGFAVGLAVASSSLGPASAQASAEPNLAKERIAVMPMRTTGDVKAGWKVRLAEEFQQGLSEGDLEVVPATRDAGELAPCTEPACYRAVAASTAAAYVLQPSLEVHDKNYNVQVEVIDGRTGETIARASESCMVCGLSDVAELVAKEALVLREKIDLLELAPAVVEFTSTPPGARVYVDGALAGMTPFRYQLPPGTHAAEAELDGYVPQTRTLHGVKGVDEEVAFSLQVDATTARRNTRLRRSGWISLGFGIAALAGGTALVVIDESPYMRDCSGENIDAEGDCRQRYNTTSYGAALMAAGGILVGTGVTLAVLGRPKPGATSDAAERPQPKLSIGPTGVALKGRF